MITRRQLVAASTFVGAAVIVPGAVRMGLARAAALPGGTLDPTTIPKYAAPLFALPAMPRTSSDGGMDTYDIAARQFSQQVLPSGFPSTRVFGYGSTSDSTTFHWPSYTIEARVDRPVRVTWRNQLVSSAGNFRSHMFAIDQTLHWANPPGGVSGRDSRPEFTTTPGPYRGPVPMVVHLHGAHVFEENDGYPEAWYLPVAHNIPRDFAKIGSFYERFRDEARSRSGVVWDPGSATFTYQNDQRATQLWFHDHDLGLTRLNIYSGQSGMYMLRGGTSDLPPGVLPGPAPRLGDAPSTRIYELPMMIQDRSFNKDGSLFFPDSRDFFGDVPPGSGFIPNNDVPPNWNPEFFGNTMAVNGRTWPTLQVEPRRYRFRLLNACNTRVVMLKIVTNPLAARPAPAALPMWVIGADGGFLPAPAPVDRLPIAVSERMDVIVDLTGVPVGTKLYIINEGPDEPFGGGEPVTDFVPADPDTTGQVMQLVVGPLAAPDTSVPPGRLSLPARTRLGAPSNTRTLSLNEMASAFFDAPVMGMLGTATSAGVTTAMHWSDPITEHPAVGATEVWELVNTTADAHPIHVHLVQFEVVSRQAKGAAPRPPQPWETGTKDTLVALPDEVTRLKARFDRAGLFVWHCHIIDHEDNEMMRPYRIG